MGSSLTSLVTSYDCCPCKDAVDLAIVTADNEVTGYRKDPVDAEPDPSYAEVVAFASVQPHLDDKHCLHHHDHDPEHHATDGYGSASDSSDEDVEIAEPTAEDMKLRKYYRRNGVFNTKFGAWNRRFLGSHKVHSSSKSTPHHDLLMSVVKRDELFRIAVEQNHTEMIVDAFEVIYPSPHTHLVDVNTPAEALFVVLEGSVSCSACSDGKKEAKNLEPGEYFGDESLLWHTNWTFTAEAGPHCVLGKMSRTCFVTSVVEKGMKEKERRIECLHACKFLETFNDEQIAKLEEVMFMRVYHPGDIIMREGQPGHHFFILEAGECSVFQGTQDFNGSPKEIIYPGTLFGEQALLDRSPRVKSVVATTEVEVLVLSRGKFERLLGPLSQLYEEHAKTDPRQIIAEFYSRGTKHGPAGFLTHHDIEIDATHHATHWFAVFRPTSRDAITKLVSGQGVGKGLNVKGKSSKKGVLSGFVPFLQINKNEHKLEIEPSPAGAWLKVFYKTSHAREEAIQALTMILSHPQYRERIELEDASAVPEDLLKRIDDYIPQSYGVWMPEALLHEAYIELEDLTPHAGWETGRASEPAFMDMNFHAIREQHNKPEVVLWQFDEGHPMNPHGLLVAYAEEKVMPVVSDFDALLVSSTGMEYDPLPADQVELAKWALDHTEEILKTPSEKSWTARWLEVLHDLADSGEHHVFPDFGYGDGTSVELVKIICSAVVNSGAIRHGAECFNFHFPQELDDEFLIVWDKLCDSEDSQAPPWTYVDEQGLRKFLLERASEGYSFPVNPVWPVRDSGWYEVLTALRKHPASQEPLESWLPTSSGMQARIDDLHKRFPDGFKVLPSEKSAGRKSIVATTAREDAELVLHTARRKAEGKQVQRKLPRPHLPALHAPRRISNLIYRESSSRKSTNDSLGQESPRRKSGLLTRISSSGSRRFSNLMGRRNSRDAQAINVAAG
jgi:CRP-like cAMP-binding protein